MKKLNHSTSLVVLVTLALGSSVNSFGKDDIDLSRTTKNFISPSQVTESCVAIAKLPIAHYKKSDIDEETRLCNLDFYNNTLALCPKVWSTSPGTIVQSFEGVAKSSSQAEALCKHSSPLKTEAKFKQTMNQSDTSGTFSAASILYYHFSRALNTTLDIPTAVYRTMDKDAHYARVTSKAKPTNKMNIAGWNWVSKAEQSTSTYNSRSDFFTPDNKKIYGALFKNSSEPYGAEINGTINTGFVKSQTPALLALKSSSNLENAITEGYANAIKDPLMKAAFSSGAPSKTQMVLWMNEVSEIAILDYIFSQQDRVDNVEYQWNWAYVDTDGSVKTQKVKDDAYKSLSRPNMNKIKAPAELAGKNAVLVQKTVIGDNDAGGLVQYANRSKSAGMLQGIAGVVRPLSHMNSKTYQRLLMLAADFKNKGPNYQVLKSEAPPLGYNDAGDKRFSQLINNTIATAQILESNCHAGVLKLDLVSFQEAMMDNFVAENTSCQIAP